MNGNILRKERVSKGLSLHEVAEHLGVSDSKMREWEWESAPVNIDIYKVAQLSLLYERYDVGFFEDVLGKKYLKELNKVMMPDTNAVDYFNDRDENFYEIMERMDPPVGREGDVDVLKFLRGFAGFSKFEAANELFLDKRTLTGYEEGEQTPSLENIIKMSELYSVPAGDLLAFFVYGKNGEHDLREKYRILREKHPEIDSQTLREYLEMTEEEFEKCEKSPGRFPVQSIFRLEKLFDVRYAYFWGVESKLEFENRIRTGYLETRKDKDETNLYLSLWARAVVQEHFIADSKGDYIGFIRDENESIIFPFSQVHVNDFINSIMFLDKNGNAIVINRFNCDLDSTRVINTGYNSSTFSLKVTAPVFPSQEIRAYEEGEERYEISFYTYPEPIPRNSAGWPEYGFDLDYEAVIFITFFDDRVFYNDYLFMKKNGVRVLEKAEPEGTAAVKEKKGKEKDKEQYEIKLQYLKDNIIEFMKVNQISKKEMARLLNINSASLSNFLNRDVSPKNLDAFFSLEYLTGHSIDTLLTKRIWFEKRNYNRNLGVNTLFYALNDHGFYPLVSFLKAVESVLCVADAFSIVIEKIPGDAEYPYEDGVQKFEVVDIKIKKETINFVTNRNNFVVSISMGEYRISRGKTRYNSLYVISFIDWYQKYGYDYRLTIEIEYPLGKQKRDRLFSFYL